MPSQLAKRTIFAVIILFLSLLWEPDMCASQTDIRESPNPLKVYFLKFPSETAGKVRVVVLIEISHDKLRFLKREDMFVARYEFSFELLDSDDNIVEGKYWDQEFTLQSFEETLEMNEIFLEPLEFELPSGFYKYYAVMTDVDSKKEFQQRDSKIFPSYWTDMFGFSDVVYSRGISDELLLKDIIPLSDELNVDYDDGFTVHLQIFSADLKPIRFSWRIVDFVDRTKVLHDESLKIKPTGHILDFSIPVTAEDVPAGVYLMQGIARHPDGKKDEFLMRVKLIWTNRPLSSYDLEESLEQMKHFLSQSVKDSIKQITEDEKRTFFEEYWNERDPTPDTRQNELMEEYFRRVVFATDNFSFKERPGWDTDRGGVYCLFGKPDKQQRFETSVQRYPQEVWTYYKARKRFTFADYNRTGDYITSREEDISR